MSKKALITGITGQDGSYLAEVLLEKGYQVVGLSRRSSSSNLQRIEPIIHDKRFEKKISIWEGDMTDFPSLRKVIDAICPDEVYNLAAMSHVKTSFDIPEYTANVDALGPLRLLEAIRECNADIRFYQASTSELFGKTQETPQTEKTPFYPRSPYGVAKLYAYWAVVNYREAYGLHACNGILFNHESPRRGESFVSRKITLGVAKILYGLQDKILLGNLNAERDWGYARDFVEGMWLMLQQDEPLDYVLATGRSYSVREFVQYAFQEVGIEIEWIGTGLHEKGIEKSSGRVLVEVSPEFFRPSEVEKLVGDPTRAREKMGWEPKTSFRELVSLMVHHDVQKIKAEQNEKKVGQPVFVSM